MKRILLSTLLLCFMSIALAVNPSGTLPVMYITTENNTPVTSKDTYLNATYYLDAKGIAGYENIGSASAPLTMEIKGRGNYSWTGFNKKPYRIKLADKQPLLGMIKSKHFTLLAHADDAKDKKGYMYVVSNSCYYGLLVYDDQYNFKGFHGAYKLVKGVG